MINLRTSRLLAAGLVLFLVAACDNAEDRARGHYERGQAFVEAGEISKADLEFRNALQLNPDAMDARLAYARLLVSIEEYDAALGNFLKVIDQDPDVLEARVTVGRILLQAGQADAASEHITAASQLAPQDIEVRGMSAMLKQQQEQIDEAAQAATALLADDAGNVWATLVLVEQARAGGNHEAAIGLLDDALGVAPENLGLNVARLQVLEAINDQARIGSQLEQMAALFPEQLRVVQARVQWFLNQGDHQGAIAAQRVLADLFPDDPGHSLNVVGLLQQFDGPEAARAELARLAEGEAHKVVFTRALADFDFGTGAADRAINLLAEFATGDLDTDDKNDINTQRAGFLWDTGAQKEARDLVDTVLAANSIHVDALRLRALAAIQDDKPEQAILDLRSALGVKPQDPAILMLLAAAHERNGSTGLAQERLGLAVQASEAGVTESLTYADFLIRTKKPEIAEDILVDTLSKRGEVPALLIGLARVQLAQSNWANASATAARLEALPDEEAVRAGNDLRLAVLAGQQKFEESTGLLRSMWEAEGERTSALENLVSNYLRLGEVDNAKDFLADILKDEPKNLRANLLLGAVLAFGGDAQGAEIQYRKVMEEHPDRANGYGALSTLLRSLGREQEADAILLDGIENASNAERLLFFQASRLEGQKKFEEAIAIYEQLYNANKLSDVLANNLASLLSEHRDDAASLERAYAIAKRLQSVDEPAFQDTYGWILYRRGEYERALPPLQAAADGAGSNAIVLFHLGMVLEKLGQKDRAIETLERALDLGGNSGLPQMDVARETLAGLKNG